MLKFLSLFGVKNKKNKKMASLSEKTSEELQTMFSPMEFEWIKGDFASTKESYKGVSENGETKFLMFSSGRRMNLDLLDEYMVYFPAPPKQIPGSVPQFAPKNSSVTSIVYDEPKISNLQEDSPIYKLLKKQKKNSVDVSIKLKLNLPSRDLYTVLSSSFEDAEKEIINFVLDGVDIEDIKRALADSIRKNYYTNVHSPKSDKQVNPIHNNKKKLEQIDESEGE